MNADLQWRRLEELSRNLWWTWQPDVWEIFEQIDEKLWEGSHHNPIVFLATIDRDTFAEKLNQRAIASRIHRVHARFTNYLAHSGPSANMEAGPLHVSPVAYFCAEFGVHESLPIYSGGLGVLAGDHMKAASDLAIPIVGIGLFYAMGYFQQGIDEDGWQKEYYGPTNIDSLPIKRLINKDGTPLEVTVQAMDAEIKIHVWETAFGRNRLLLLDADVEGNTEADRKLTHQLYHGDHRVRIRQELLLGVGGVRVLDALGIRPGAYHLNEGHSAFAPLEVCRQLMEREGIGFWEARSKVLAKTVFTTHTPVPAGHDRFDPHLLEETVGPLREALGLDHRTFHGFGRVNLDNPKETFCMTVLAMKMSHYRNGVSNLHGHVSRSMWRELWPGLDRALVPIDHITNGVHTGTFLAPVMRQLYDRHLERGWENHLEKPEAWKGLAQVEAAELWETHQILKTELLDFVRRRVENQEAPTGKKKGEVMPGSGLDPEILTIGFARRFATYKRADLIMRDIERFEELVTDKDRPIQIIMAGKAHPADDGGKALIQKIVKATCDPKFKGRVVFLADYDMDIGRRLVQGVDVWLNNPRRPQEACGTSGQKVVLNGALNFSVLDGWWAEGYDGMNGFAIGHREEFSSIEAHDIHDAKRLYDTLENEVIPLYYKRVGDLPEEWIERMRWALVSLGWRFNANRMVLDYMRKFYLPASGATVS